MGVSVIAVHKHSDESTVSLSRHQTEKIKHQVKKWLRNHIGPLDLNEFMDKFDPATTQLRLEFQSFLNEEVLPSLTCPIAEANFSDITFHPKEDGQDTHMEIVLTIGGADPSRQGPGQNLGRGTTTSSSSASVDAMRPSPSKLRQTLRNKIQSKNHLRKSSCDKESELWKVHDQLSRLCANKKDVKIPTPSEIKANKAMFEPMVEHIPNKHIKMYVQDCLLAITDP